MFAQRPEYPLPPLHPSEVRVLVVAIAGERERMRAVQQPVPGGDAYLPGIRGQVVPVSRTHR
jgi:hypothetical protein